MLTLLTSDCYSFSNLLHKDFRVTTIPNFLYKNGEITTNFDVYFIFDEFNEDVFETCQLLGIPMIGTKRFEKQKQSLILKKFNIYQPKTYSVLNSVNADSFNFELLLNDVKDDEKIILKSNNGARGIGQVLLSRGELFDLVDGVYKENTNDDDIAEKFKIGNVDEDNRNFLTNSIKSSSFIVQEVENVVNEYRWIYLYNQKPILIKRKINSESWQNNVSVAGKGTPIKYDKKFDKIKNKIDELASYLNVPFLSLDVFENERGEYGIFEFQMQMAISSVPKYGFADKIVKSVKDLMKDKYKLE